MHQPYYKNLLTNEAAMPWVRLHGAKDYLDMVKILKGYPKIHQVFNLVPSLVEQIEDYTNNAVKDRFLELSYKPAAELSQQDKQFILERFFSIDKDRVTSVHPRFYELYLKKQSNREYKTQDYLDLQVWFNLAWTDPYFRANIPEISELVNKGRFFTEEEKQIVLDKQRYILEEILPTYREFNSSGQIELTVSPFYHPITPLLVSTKIAKEANPAALLPKTDFIYPHDAKAQIDNAVNFCAEKFGRPPEGMWPSEEAVSEHILPFIIQSGIKWIVADEGILFKSLRKKKRNTRLLYQPHLLKRKDGNLNIIFRDRNLSDLISFVYHTYKTEDAVNDLMKHLKNTAEAFGGHDPLVAIAMDGENAWEYYPNDGHDFLNLLYKKLSEADYLKTTTIKEYLERHKATNEIKRLAAGSWIYANFSKWIGNPYKNKAWEYLAKAREELDKSTGLDPASNTLAWKQMYILEGSDWFWWYGENHADFDQLFRAHLSNFYKIIGKEIPEYLNYPLESR